MIRLNALASYGLCISLWFFTGCSSSSDPKPIDCDKSDLDIGLISKTNPASCIANDGSIEVEATGGKESYTFSKDGTNFQSSSTFTGLGGGDYLIYVKDKNGCKRSLEVSLVIPGVGALSASQTGGDPDTQCIGSNGTIEVTATGGTGVYEYKIGSGAYGPNSTFSSLSPGSYIISVKDNGGCVFTLNATVTQGSTGITYDGEIKAIFNLKCDGSGCHPDNGDWFTYSTAKANAAEIKSRTQSGNMPKTGSLTTEEKALIACWVDGGAPQ